MINFRYFTIFLALIFGVGGLILIYVVANKNPNSWFGIRNRYTYSDKEIWRKTNIIAGWINVFLFVLVLIPCFFVESSNRDFYLIYPYGVIILGTLFNGGVTYFYSKRKYLDT